MKKEMIQASLEKEGDVTSFEEGWRYTAYLLMTCSVKSKPKLNLAICCTLDMIQ